MEYVEPEAPSKPNFMAFNLTHSTPSFSDDDFFIDDLLDFSTDAAFLDENHNLQLDDTTNNHKTSPVNEDKTTPPETELCFPVNDVDDLEWVSRFVDDSVTYPVRKFPETETVTLVAVNATFKKLVNKRARSKRSRGSGGVWSLRSSAPLTESSTSSSSITSCTSKPLFGADENMEKATVQIRKRKRQAVMGGSARTSQPQTRRCSHCLVQKTPQWRAGPLGEKTLCNACGVRFKSGRLLPEYRPACSPSYSGEVHSNNHRKVLEMRRKKAACGGLIFPVHSS